MTPTAQMGLALWLADPAALIQVAAVLAAAAGLWLRTAMPPGAEEEQALLTAMVM